MDIKKKKQKKKSYQNTGAIGGIRITFIFFCFSLVHETFARHCGKGVQYYRSEGVYRDISGRPVRAG